MYSSVHLTYLTLFLTCKNVFVLNFLSNTIRIPWSKYHRLLITMKWGQTMKQILQQVKEELEKAYDNPQSNNLDQCLLQLQAAREEYGDKGNMIENCIKAVTQARNSIVALENAGDVSSGAAFGQAHNAIQNAIESYSGSDNNQYE